MAMKARARSWRSERQRGAGMREEGPGVPTMTRNMLPKCLQKTVRLKTRIWKSWATSSGNRPT
jgi:hypothetical protein